MGDVDYFNRQRKIDQWDQDKLEKQVALCLGMGGLGSTVALNLCRLGFKKMFIVDKDVVDAHNLNRQILYNKDAIGKSKFHNLRTEIVPLELDILHSWEKIVEVSKECTVIFNMVDIGNYFDYACQSLALNRGIPMVIGGTYQSTLTIDFITGTGQPCWSCMSDLDDKELQKKLSRDKVETYKSLDCIIPEVNPTGLSNVFVCCTCCNLMVSAFIQHLFGTTIPTRQIMYISNYEIDKWAVEKVEKCALCGTGEAEAPK